MKSKHSLNKKPIKATKRHSKVTIPLSFNQAIKGILGLSAEDAKSVRDSAKKKR